MGDMADYINDPWDPDVPLHDYGGVKACRCCGKGGLHWEDRDGKWVLCGFAGFKSVIHDCPVKPLPAGKL